MEYQEKPTFIKLGDTCVHIAWTFALIPDPAYDSRRRLSPSRFQAAGRYAWTLAAHRMEVAYFTGEDDTRSASRTQPSVGNWQTKEGAQPLPKLEWLA